jgi:hypothetical protein
MYSLAGLVSGCFRNFSNVSVLDSACTITGLPSGFLGQVLFFILLISCCFFIHRSLMHLTQNDLLGSKYLLKSQHRWQASAIIAA